MPLTRRSTLSALALSIAILSFSAAALAGSKAPLKLSSTPAVQNANADGSAFEVAFGLTALTGDTTWRVEVHPSTGWQALVVDELNAEYEADTIPSLALYKASEKMVKIRLRLADSSALLDDGYTGLLIRLSPDDARYDAWQKFIYLHTATGHPVVVTNSEYLESINVGSAQEPLIHGMGLHVESEPLVAAELTDPQLIHEYNKSTKGQVRGAKKRVAHYVYGALKFWDARPNRSAQGATGSRFKYCNIKNLNCSPNDADCCWTFIPNARVNLHLNQPDSTIISTYQASQYGGFVLSDPNWVSGRDYWLSIDSEHIGYPLQIRMTAEPGNQPFRFDGIANFTMPNTTNTIGEISINAALDYTSGDAHYLTDWTSYQETAEWITADGELRHRKNYGSQNAYDTIEVVAYNATRTVTCNTSRIFTTLSDARTQQPMRDFGRILHGRVVGCTGSSPAFPPYDLNFEGVQDGAEGPAAYYAIPELIYAISMRDPATAPAPSNTLAGMACWDNSFLYNSNSAVSYTNTANALWDFIDTSTSGSDDGYTDNVDLTLVNIMTSLQNWMAYLPGNPGLNRSANEWYETNTQFPCATNYDCGAGDVCSPGSHTCYTGDVHGDNIRDWAYHIAVQSGLSETSLWQTLTSCPCVLPADNSYPFTGGYRAD